jgi:hypothetical protein
VKLAYGPAYDAEYDNAMACRVAPRYRRMGLEPIAPVAFLDTCPPSLQVEGWARPTGHQYLRPEPYSRHGSSWAAPDFERGLPLVLLPQGADQFVHARQVASAHAGIVLLPNEATPAAIGSALQQVLTDRSIRAAAQDIAEEIANG